MLLLVYRMITQSNLKDLGRNKVSGDFKGFILLETITAISAPTANFFHFRNERLFE